MVIKRHLLSALGGVLLAAIILLLGRSTTSLLMGIEENFYLKYYYSIRNYKTVDNYSQYDPDSLVIFNLKQYHNRKEQADVLRLLYECSPRVIGVDVYFPENPDISLEINDYLVSVVKTIKDKSVFPCFYENNEDSISVRYPFFKNLPELQDIKYATPLAIGFYDKYLPTDKEILDDDKISHPRMSLAIVQASGFKKQHYDNYFFTNYCKKNLTPIILDNISQINERFIKDKIVIVGNLSNIQDTSFLPFRFGKRDSISGTEVIAYETISLIDSTDKNLLHRTRSRGITMLPWLFTIFLSFCICILFSMLRIQYKRIEEKLMNKGTWPSIGAILLKPFLFLFAEVFVIGICFFYTFLTNEMPDLFLSMIGIATVGISAEVVDLIIKNKK